MKSPAHLPVELGEGIGLLEAAGIDDYASDDERAALRAKDEKKDWRRISTESLNCCYSSPAFSDARGFVFHLPAFLIAELNDQHGYGFIDRLIDLDRPPSAWVDILSDEQKGAIIRVLQLVAQHPEYRHKSGE